VILSDDHQWLFAVNAGSDSIASFRIRPGQGLELVSTVPSGGSMPISLAFYNGLLYALNAGIPNNVTGFTVAAMGPGATSRLDPTVERQFDRPGPGQLNKLGQS
jgi:6-phosphogluconolactonase (cycloisomerase 2 family)